MLKTMLMSALLAFSLTAVADTKPLASAEISDESGRSMSMQITAPVEGSANVIVTESEITAENTEEGKSFVESLEAWISEVAEKTAEQYHKLMEEKEAEEQAAEAPTPEVDEVVEVEGEPLPEVKQ